MSEVWDIHTAVSQISRCGFECEAGALENNSAWAWLEKSLSGGPKYALGQRVNYEVAGEVSGIRIANTLPFVVVGIRMESTADGLAWGYDLSNDPPAAYHYGNTVFKGIPEKAIEVSR